MGGLSHIAMSLEGIMKQASESLAGISRSFLMGGICVGLCLLAIGMPRVVDSLLQSSGESVINVVGVIVQPDERGAVLEDSRTQQQEIFREGQIFFNYAELMKVSPSSLTIRLLQTAEVIKVPVAGGAIYRFQERGRSVDESRDSNLLEEYEGTFFVQRNIFDTFIKSPTEMIGDIDGYEPMDDPYSGEAALALTHVTPESLLGRLGMMDGDMLLSINGEAATDPLLLIGAARQIRINNRFDMKLMVRRNGETQELSLLSPALEG